MALSPVQEAQVLELLAQQSALLSLASNESVITSKLSATKKNLSALSSASTLADSDLMFVRQGTTDKSVSGSIIKSFINPLETPFATTDSVTLPNGLIFKWGSANTNGSGVYAGSFDVPFPNNCLVILPIDEENVAANVCYAGASSTASTFTLTFAKGGVATNANAVKYFAIGY